MKLGIKSLIEQVVVEEMARLKEAKPFQVNKKYNVFAIEKATNKIVNGWDLDPKDKENIREYITKTSPYVKMDLKDLDYKPSDVSIVSIKTAKSKGLDPFSWDSWKKHTDEVKEATTTLVTPDGKTLTPAQQAQVKTAKPGTTIVTKKVGEISEDADITEKKEDKPTEDVPPVDDKAVEPASPVEAGKGLSAELNNHISSAIDAAAKCIQDSGDKKYEKVLGKVVKNLTAAQSALDDVQAHETKLAEEAAAEAEKTTASYTKDLRKVLNKNFKNPEHIEKLVSKYGKVIKQSTGKPVEKIAEMIAAHALKEGFIKKGDILNEFTVGTTVKFREPNRVVLRSSNDVEKSLLYDLGNSLLKIVKDDNLFLLKDGEITIDELDNPLVIKAIKAVLDQGKSATELEKILLSKMKKQ